MQAISNVHVGRIGPQAPTPVVNNTMQNIFPLNMLRQSHMCCTCYDKVIYFVLMFAWMWKGYGNLDKVSFWLVLHFLHPAQFLKKLVYPMSETSCDPAPLWNCVDQPANTLLWLHHFLSFYMALSFTMMCFIATFSGDTWHDNCSGFSVSWKTVCFGNVNTFSLIANNPLLCEHVISITSFSMFPAGLQHCIMIIINPCCNDFTAKSGSNHH